MSHLSRLHFNQKVISTYLCKKSKVEEMSFDQLAVQKQSDGKRQKKNKSLSAKRIKLLLNYSTFSIKRASTLLSKPNFLGQFHISVLFLLLSPAPSDCFGQRVVLQKWVNQIFRRPKPNPSTRLLWLTAHSIFSPRAGQRSSARSVRSFHCGLEKKRSWQ